MRRPTIYAASVTYTECKLISYVVSLEEVVIFAVLILQFSNQIPICPWDRTVPYRIHATMVPVALHEVRFELIPEFTHAAL